MKKFGKSVAGSTRKADEHERRRARSKSLPEPDQNPLYRAQFLRQDSSTEEELLSSDEDTPSASSVVTGVVPAPDSERLECVSTSPVKRGMSLAVQEAIVRLETRCGIPLQDKITQAIEQKAKNNLSLLLSLTLPA